MCATAINVAVGVVRYNTCDLLRRCLASVHRAAAAAGAAFAVQTVVVDNASADGSPAMVAAEFPHVRLLALDGNLGFTGANNLALASLGFSVPARPGRTSLGGSRPDSVLLLNPDAELEPEALAEMASFLASTSQAGVCGARLSYGNGRFQHGAFRFPTLFQVALDFFPLAGLPGAHRLHNSRLNGRYPAALWAGRTPFRVDFVLGAAMMVAGAAIEAAGGLDDGFFMYCEEMDWCLRLAEAGWSCWAVPTARVTHHEAQSSRQVRWDAYRRLWRSRLRFYAKHRRRYSAGYRLALRLLISAGLARRAAAAERTFARGGASGTAVAAELAAYRDVRRMVWAKPQESAL